MGRSSMGNPKLSVLMCHACGYFGLTSKVCCPFCGEIGMVDAMDYQRADPIEQQLMSALSMWQRVRTTRNEDGDTGRKAFKIVWHRAYGVLKFWDKAIKLCRKKGDMR